jgi:hypothetical protein
MKRQGKTGLCGRSALVCVFLWFAGAFAAPVFADTLAFLNADPPLGTTFRSAGIPIGAGAYLSIGASDVTISQIAINAAPGQDGQLKFVIFADTDSQSVTDPLLFSDTVNVTASGTLSYILSDPISFTLQAGHYYDIGAIFDGSSINYSYDLVANTQNGISSIVANANFDNFTAPIVDNHAGADINIGLYVVPEPSGLTLASLGLGMFACLRRHCRK